MIFENVGASLVITLSKHKNERAKMKEIVLKKIENLIFLKKNIHDRNMNGFANHEMAAPPPIIKPIHPISSKTKEFDHAP